MKQRSNAAKARHAESLIKVGENIHNSIILSTLVAPLIFLSKQIMEGKVIDFIWLMNHLFANFWILLAVFILMTGTAYIGSRMKWWGFDLLDELNKLEDTNASSDLNF
ncbi:hypothetical protein CXF80_10140 [Shewanella sp. Actino-trap-3]|jgi:hypothetical protein|uniref:hypothetical protein n=1 Tax=Shewanella sp. Actino-trap-3 TaxID=2058331 RepID=UPI000C331194|nr:hypothetical protein [Shewanella sp. Actino-trap-3]PKG78645.1 hypothetical protein CXF80_10140 [Shewanella sp. Actino-trap-3]